MDFARGVGPAFAGAMALTNDLDPVCLNRDAHLGCIDGKEGAAVFTGQQAARFNGLPAPAIEAKDAFGLRDRLPTLDIREFASVGCPAADKAMIEIALKRLALFV